MSQPEGRVKVLRVEIVTPDGPVLVEEVQRVVVPGEAGELGVLPRHSPLIARLEPGETRVLRIDGEWASYATSEGFFKVQRDVASVLMSHAVARDEVDLEAVRRALEDAQSRLAAAQGGDESVDVHRAERDVATAEAQLRVAGAG